MKNLLSLIVVFFCVSVGVIQGEGIGPINRGDTGFRHVEYYSDDTIIVVRNSYMAIVLNRHNGIIRGLTVRGHSGLLSLSEPGQIIFRDTLINYLYQQKNGRVIDIDTSISPNLVRVSFRVNFSYHKAMVSYTMDTLVLRWDSDLWLRPTSPSGIDRALRIEFSLPLFDKMTHTFWADGDAPFKIGDYFYKVLKYRHNWFVLPLVVLYDTTLDYGLSFVCPFEVKKPALSFVLQKNPSSDTFLVSYNYLRTSRAIGRPAKASLYIVPHVGDWRPGLAWVLNQYPEYFNVHPNSNTLENEGRFFFSTRWTFEAKPEIDTCRIFGVKWTEYYHNKAFFGLYAPQDRSRWFYISDLNTWTTYADWHAHGGSEEYSYGYIRRGIDTFKVRGDMAVYPYFNACDVWRMWVRTGGDTFPYDNSVAIDANGDTITGFHICWTMNPDTNLYPPNQPSWAAHIDSQVSAVIDSYCVSWGGLTTAAGIFLDRVDYWAYDYAHSDGVSMINTTPVYMLGFALEEINEKICRRVHEKNKSIIANGPLCIEVCKNIDAIMTEIFLGAVGAMQYLGLARPMILFVIDKLAKETEIKDKTALFSGYFPSLEHEVNEYKSRLIDLKYKPLFELFKGKRWVLYPNVLRLPLGIKGNIFKGLNNDLLIPMVSMEKSQLLPDPFTYNLKIKISYPGLDNYKYCYLLSGDYVGPRWVSYDPMNQEMLNIPEHMVSSLIRLSQKPCYEYSLLSSPVLVRGRRGTFKLRVQNLDDTTKKYSLLLKTPFGNENYQFSLEPHQVREIRYDFNIPRPYPIKEDSFLVINTRSVPHDTSLFTLWVYDPLTLKLPEIYIKFPVGDSFNLVFVNNTQDTMDGVRLGYRFIQGHGKMGWGPKSFRMNPFETKEEMVYIDIKDTSGIIQVFATHRGDTVGSITKPLKRAMRPTPGDIFCDDFDSGEMSERWRLWDPREAWSVEDSSAKGSGAYWRHFATVGAGDESLTNYRFQMNTRLLGSTLPNIPYLKSYLYFRIKSDADTMYYRFGIKGDEPNLTLFRRDGERNWTWLGGHFLEPQKNVWYNLSVRVLGSNIRCFLNGEQVISKYDAKYSSGGIGIGINEDFMTNYYDDIVLRPLVWPPILFADNFDAGYMDPLWKRHQGIWSFPPEEPGIVRASGGAHFATVAEGCDWANFRYSIRTRIKGSEIVGSLRSYLFFRVQDTLNFYRFGIFSERGLEFHKQVDGEWTLLRTYFFRPQKDIWYTLKVETMGAEIKCYLNDTLRITYTDTLNPFINGGIGIGVIEPEGIVVDYDDVKVERR